jgi:hypothetical protein
VPCDEAELAPDAMRPEGYDLLLLPCSDGLPRFRGNPVLRDSAVRPTGAVLRTALTWINAPASISNRNYSF